MEGMNTMNEVERLLQENIALVERLYSAYSDKDIPRLLETLAEDIDWLFQGPEQIPFAGHYRGHEEVAKFFAEAANTSEFLLFEPREFTPGKSNVLVEGFERGYAKATGRTWETGWAHVFTIQNQKIIKMREYYDTAVIARAFQAERPEL
jgi:ketosteroid isomerase-like protein